MTTNHPPRQRRSGYHARGSVKVVHDPTGLFRSGVASFTTLDIVEMVHFLPLGFTIHWPARGRCVLFPVGLIDTAGNVLKINNGNHHWTRLPEAAAQ